MICGSCGCGGGIMVLSLDAESGCPRVESRAGVPPCVPPVSLSPGQACLLCNPRGLHSLSPSFQSAQPSLDSLVHLGTFPSSIPLPFQGLSSLPILRLSFQPLICVFFGTGLSIFYFEMILELQKLCKNGTKSSHVPFVQCSPMFTSYRAIVRLPKPGN